MRSRGPRPGVAALSPRLPAGAPADGLLVALHYPGHRSPSPAAHLQVLVLAQAQREEEQRQQLPPAQPPRHGSPSGASWARRPAAQALVCLLRTDGWTDGRPPGAGGGRAGGRRFYTSQPLPPGTKSGCRQACPEGSRTAHSSSLPTSQAARSPRGLGFINVTPWPVLLVPAREEKKRKKGMCAQLETGSVCPGARCAEETGGEGEAAPRRLRRLLEEPPTGLPGNPGSLASSPPERRWEPARAVRIAPALP